MNRIVRLLTASALVVSAGCVPAQAWQEASPEPALIDLAPQRYPVPDVPYDLPSSVPDVGSDAAGPADGGAGLHYDLRVLDTPAYDYGYRPAGTGLRWFGPAADPSGREAAGFGPLTSTGLDAWSLGARNWRYRSSAGYGVTLGNMASGAPAWGRPVRLAGVGVSRVVPQGRLPAGSWDYSVAAGALDGAAGSVAAEGDLAYGPAAFDAVTRYAPDRDLILASRLQGARGLAALGLGGDYALGDAGTWQFGVSGSRQALAEGWRRQLGYTLGLYPGLDATWVNARQGAGYADLAAYGGAAGCDCVSNQWQLDWAAGRWGALSGSFERRVDASGVLDERIGLVHGFHYGPYLRVRLETQRNLTSGDYGLGARFFLPLD